MTITSTLLPLKLQGSRAHRGGSDGRGEFAQALQGTLRCARWGAMVGIGAGCEDYTLEYTLEAWRTNWKTLRDPENHWLVEENTWTQGATDPGLCELTRECTLQHI